MKSFKKAALYGFLIWLIVFAIAFLIFPIRETNRAFFESIMPVVISIVTSFFTFKYLVKVESNFVKESLYFGIIATVINWLIDALLILSPSPMQMTLSDYFQDIGFTYFMILPITLGFGFIANHLSQKRN
jgi:hypothetical protein